MNLTVKKKLI